jgi:hypothetical protein
MNMHFETAGSARTPPTNRRPPAGCIGADRAAWRSDGGRQSIEARRSALIGPTVDLMGEIDRSHGFARAAPNPTRSGLVEPLRSSAASLENGAPENEEGNFPACKALKSHKTGK